MSTRRLLLASGLHLAVHEHGSGRAVVLVHAWGETHRSFDRLVPLLVPLARLVVPDQRGVGGSDKPDDGYDLRQGAADLIGLLDALDLDSAVFLGTSSGGYLAQCVAVEYPDRVDGLVLVGSPRSLAGGRDPFGGVLAGFHDPVTREDIVALNDGLVFRGAVPEEFLAAQDAAALTIPRRVWRASYRGLLDATPPLDAGRISAPTLVLWGSADDLLPRDQAEALVHDVDEGRLVVTDTGHMVLWEVPHVVAQEVRLFLTEPRHELA
jgi:rifampin ADP-ribosylating transferase